MAMMLTKSIMIGNYAIHNFQVHRKLSVIMFSTTKTNVVLSCLLIIVSIQIIIIIHME